LIDETVVAKSVNREGQRAEVKGVIKNVGRKLVFGADKLEDEDTIHPIGVLYIKSRIPIAIIIFLA